MWFGLAGLSEMLMRGAAHDVFRCIYCNNRELTRSNNPMETMLRDGRMQKVISCNKCGKELTYLNERTYGLTLKQISQQHNDASKSVWKRRPLWSLTNESER